MTLSSPLRVSMIVKTEYSEEQRWQDLQSLNRRFPSGTPEVMEVLFGNHDMLRAGEGRPAWVEPAHDQPIEDEQVNEVEDERHAESIGEEFPKERLPRAAVRQSNAEVKGTPMSRPSKIDIRCSFSDLGGTISRISLG